MQQLLSKLIAGGLSAAVILLWWPSVFPSDTVESWLVRGVIWTLSFELMLHALGPIEESLWRTRAARRVRDHAVAAGARLTADSPRRRKGGRSVVAVGALAVPLLLLATAPTRPANPPEPVQQVRHVTEVKRVVKIERHRVAVPVPVAAQAAPAAQAGAATRSTVARRAPARSSQPSASTRRPDSSSTDEQTSTATPPRTADPPLATQSTPAPGGDQAAATDAPAQPKTTRAPRVDLST